MYSVSIPILDEKYIDSLVVSLARQGISVNIEEDDYCPMVRFELNRHEIKEI